MERIVPNLWFDKQAEEAANYYVSLFPNSRIESINHYGPSVAAVSGMPEGSVLGVDYVLDGQHYTAINGGPVYTFTPAVSLLVNCATQQEVDRLWDAFCEEGTPLECGWLTDKYGVTWQIVPVELLELVNDPDPVRAERVTSAMLKMIKLDVNELRRVYNGG